MTIKRLGTITLRVPGPRIPDLTDPDAIAAVLAGDRGAFATLVHRHNQTMYRACRAVLGNGHDAVETMLDAWIDAFHKLESVPTVRSWVAKRAIETVSRRARTTRGGSVIGGSALECVLDDLPDAMRSVLVLSDVIGLDAAAAASCLEIDEDNVHVRLLRARHVLAQRLAEPNFDLPRAATDVWRFDGDRAASMLLQVMTRVNDLPTP